MQIAVIADIHGNYVALKKCLNLAFSRGIQTFIFLGDYIGELAYPERTMQILYNLHKQYSCYFIKGNKEEYWLNYKASGEKGWYDKNSTTGALYYAYGCLNNKDLDFFSQLKPVDEIVVKNMPPLLLCHGSPYGVSDKLLPNDDKTMVILDKVESPIILCGHTHRQGKIIHKGKYVFNPGSVGIPITGEGKTQFLILHGNNGIWDEEFLSLEYDVDKVIKELYEVKLDVHAPYWSLTTEYILRNGNMSHATVLNRAMELCKAVDGNCVWPSIPEKFWAQAVEEICM